MAPRARLALALSAAGAALLACAGSAAANSASIAVTASNGASDPAAYSARVFTVSGTAAAGDNLYMKQHPAGGAPCAPTAYSDQGRLSTGFYGLPVNGSFTFQRVWTWDAPGAWTFCIWLAPSETAIATPLNQTILFRTPNGQIASSIQPRAPRVGQRAEVTVAGSSEAPRRIWVKVRAASGGACAPSYDLDPGQSLIDGWDAEGGFDAKRYTTQTTPGRYLICSWLAGSSWDALPVAGPSSLLFDVMPPKPVVASSTAVNCRTRKAVTRVQARTLKSVCVRYRFAKAPTLGTKLSVSYITPARRTYKTVTSTWTAKSAQSLISAPLPGRAYEHRRGTWRATLRASGATVKTTTFRVI
jgi:hypothetical protein